MRALSLLLACLAVLASSLQVSASSFKVCGTPGAKEFAIKSNTFVDAGPGVGFAQLGFKDLTGQVTTALLKTGFLAKGSKLTSYVEKKGCYKTMIEKAGANMVGEYEFLYEAEYSRKVGKLLKNEFYRVKVMGTFTRGKVLLKGKADVVQLPNRP